ncbi:hypothetical protein SBRY_20183 [Actinacidiphila bryophytorum]|uniref:ABC transporter type 1 GsiC-like N-terminal domain-containing protein n=1 Tax=Actinacidiphila bryophytorum TaxID=1436133 RepID=A0A9W4EDM4_9ACTN|nr:hypothetical protein SBRY_20183 [Actinacidiphila bryophytorum]
MVRFLVRRAVNYLVLVFLAATMTYFIAASALEPIVNYLQKHPQPPTSTIHNLLRAQNLDPDTPIAVRYWRWLTGVLHGDFGTTYTGDSVRAGTTPGWARPPSTRRCARPVRRSTTRRTWTTSRRPTALGAGRQPAALPAPGHRGHQVHPGQLR